MKTKRTKNEPTQTIKNNKIIFVGFQNFQIFVFTDDDLSQAGN